VRSKRKMLCVKSNIYAHPQWPNSPSGPEPPHYCGFTVTFGRNSLDGWSARHRDLYLTTHNTHRKETFMPQVVGFEPAIPESQRPQAQALDRAVIWVGSLSLSSQLLSFHVNSQTCIPRDFKWFFKPPQLSVYQALPVLHFYNFCASDCVFGWLEVFNPLNAELNPFCYLLALLAHHFLHVSRIMVKSLTLRLLMSYIQGVTGGRDKTSGECSLC